VAADKRYHFRGVLVDVLKQLRQRQRQGLVDHRPLDPLLLADSELV